MDASDSLILDAKQAILEEQHRRFQALQEEGKWGEAMQQFHATMVCASDLLTEALGLLDKTLNHRSPEAPPDRRPDSSA